MNFKRISIKLDRVGVIASTLCAVHCAALPLVIVLLPVADFRFLSDPRVEWMMIFTAAIVGVFSLGVSFIKIHKRIWPLILFAAGLSVIAVSHAELRNWAEGTLVASGGILIVIAHFVNSKYIGTCSTKNAILHLKDTHSNGPARI